MPVEHPSSAACLDSSERLSADSRAGSPDASSVRTRLRYLLIANPRAGRGRAARLAADVHRLLTNRGADAALSHTTAPGGAESLARRALETADGDGRRLCVVGCGGDGTTQEIANALMAAPPGRGILGLAPGGRCNDFASAFGVRPEAASIADTLVTGTLRRIDIGRVNSRHFCTIAAMGFDAAVSRYVNDMRMPLAGTPAYIYGVLQVLRTYRPPQVRLILDQRTHEGPVFMAASANTSSYGGRMQIAPHASASDGLLDVCLVSSLKWLRVLLLLRRVMRGLHADLPEVEFVRSRMLRVESEKEQEIWADGELIGKTPATIEILPAAVEMIGPRSRT